MRVLEGLMMVLASIGVLQALFLILVLLRHRPLATTNLFLSLILLGLSLRIGKSVFNHYLEIAPWQRNLGLSGLLIVGPSLHFYWQALINQSTPSASKLIFHYAPALIFVGLCWLIPNNFDFWSRVSYTLVSLHLLAYWVDNSRWVWGARGQALGTEQPWLQGLNLGLGLLWLYYALVFVRVNPFYLGGALVYSLLIYGLSYFIWQGSFSAQRKYHYSAQTEQQSAMLTRQLLQLLETEQLYLQPKLTLNDLAAKLAVPAKQLSQAINSSRQQSFRELLTAFRLAHAKRLLKDPAYQQAKLAAVAVDSGFGNLTSFHQAFKAAEQLTPSEYRLAHSR